MVKDPGNVYAFGRRFYPKRLTGRVRGSCLRTPTGGSTFHAGDLNPGLPRSPTQKVVIIPVHYPVPNGEYDS